MYVSLNSFKYSTTTFLQYELLNIELNEKLQASGIVLLEVCAANLLFRFPWKPRMCETAPLFSKHPKRARRLKVSYH